MNNSREILDLHSPVKEITLESVGYMEKRDRYKFPLKIDKKSFSEDYCLKENLYCPYPIDNSVHLFSTLDVMYMAQHVFTKPLSSVEIAGKLNILSKEILTDKIVSSVSVDTVSGGMMNPIIHAVNNFIFSTLLNDSLAPYCTGLQLYQFTVTDKVKYADCYVYELFRENRDSINYILVNFVNAKSAVIYLLSNNPFNGLIPFATIVNGIVTRLINTINSSEDIDEAIVENYSISLLEELNGKEYPKFNTDFDSILKSSGIIDESYGNSGEAFILGVNEGAVTNASRKAKAKIIKADRNISGKIDKLAADVKETTKKALLPDAREDIIKDSLPSLSKLIKIAVVTGAAYAINPAIAAIGAFTVLLLRNKARKNERRKILAELREEHELVEEKIKDAESKGDNKNKYQLMRLRNKLKTSIERISYGDNFVDKRSSTD